MAEVSSAKRERSQIEWRRNKVHQLLVRGYNHIKEDKAEAEQKDIERVGFAVDIFNEPLLALESFKPDRYSLVLLDVMMRKMMALSYTIS